MEPLRTLARRLAGARVLCVGDIMLDRFLHGSVDRISPEAPIPVLLVREEKDMLGGVGNVAANLSALGAAPAVFSVVGADDAGRRVENLLEMLDACSPRLLADTSRPTTVKTRCVGQHQQMLRIDREVTTALRKEDGEELALRVRAALPGHSVVLISDYRKGVLTHQVLPDVIAQARRHGVPVLVDPKGTDYAPYVGATLITPNRSELAAATGMPVRTDEEVEAACRNLLARYGFEAVLATRSEDGMTLVPATGEVTHIKAKAREVFDVAGAGDTVIATLAAALAAGASLPVAAELANVAAGIVVGKAGTATTTAEELLHELREAETRGFDHKVEDLAGAQQVVAGWKRQGLKVGFTNGCFDLLHPGHVSLLAAARGACDRLVVGLNTDASVRRLKGSERPVQGEAARATVLASLASTDLVVPFEEDTPLRLIEALRPDILMKGADYTVEQVVGHELVHAYGGEVRLLDLVPGHSTSNIVRKLRQTQT